MNKRVVMVSVIALIIILIFFNMPSGDQQLAFMHYYLHDMHTFVHHHYAISVILFLLLCIVITLFMVPIAILLSLLSGYLYGVIWGTVYSITGAVMGGVLTVFLVRSYEQRFFSFLRLNNQDFFAHVTDQLNKRGIWFILIANCIPIVPASLINIAVGLSEIPLLLFVVATTVGLIPCTFMYALAGRELHALRSLGGFIDKRLLGVLAMVVLGLLIYRWMRRQKKSN